jgi:hypothetical protein
MTILMPNFLDLLKIAINEESSLHAKMLSCIRDHDSSVRDFQSRYEEQNLKRLVLREACQDAAVFRFYVDRGLITSTDAFTDAVLLHLLNTHIDT